MPSTMKFIYLFLKILFSFLERGEGRKKERERNIDVWEKYQSVASHNPGMCPDWELNQPPFGSQEST